MSSSQFLYLYVDDAHVGTVEMKRGWPLKRNFGFYLDKLREAHPDAESLEVTCEPRFAVAKKPQSRRGSSNP